MCYKQTTVAPPPKNGFLEAGELQMVRLLCEQCLSLLGHPVPLKSWMLFPKLRAGEAWWVFGAGLATEEASASTPWGWAGSFQEFCLI